MVDLSQVFSKIDFKIIKIPINPNDNNNNKIKPANLKPNKLNFTSEKKYVIQNNIVLILYLFI